MVLLYIFGHLRDVEDKDAVPVKLIIVISRTGNKAPTNLQLPFQLDFPPSDIRDSAADQMVSDKKLVYVTVACNTWIQRIRTPVEKKQIRLI